MNSSWRLMVWAVRNVDSATWTVHIDESWPITSGHRNAFQPPMKVITAIAAKKAPRVRHHDPPVRARSSPSPSTRAASSSSLGKPRKYCRNRNAVKPLNSTGMMSPGSVATQPSGETSTKRG